MTVLESDKQNMKVVRHCTGVEHLSATLATRVKIIGRGLLITLRFRLRQSIQATAVSFLGAVC